MGFFESDIVQEEAKKLFTDYQELMKLGSDYGKFDREGKKMFIKKMESLMDRYKVFMKRINFSFIETFIYRKACLTQSFIVSIF